MDKLTKLLQSRKFWALVAALVAVWTGYAHGLPLEQAINLTVAALASYAIGTGLEDSKPQPPGQPAQ